MNNSESIRKTASNEAVFFVIDLMPVVDSLYALSGTDIFIGL